MSDYWVVISVLCAFTAGLYLGGYLQAARWREKGNHDYMNRMESDGHLYIVKREMLSDEWRKGRPR